MLIDRMFWLVVVCRILMLVLLVVVKIIFEFWLIWVSVSFEFFIGLFYVVGVVLVMFDRIIVLGFIVSVFCV